MLISIDVNSSEAIFSQLVEQIKQAVASGQLKPGAPLPAIRQLANDLGLNPNTVSKAYKRLERDNIVVGKGYRGTFIHDDAPSHCDVDLKQDARLKIDSLLNELRQMGLTDSEIRLEFSASLKHKGN